MPLIALTRWILDAASSDEFRRDQGHPESLTLSAFSDEDNLIIQISKAHHQRQVRLDQTISAATNLSNEPGEYYDPETA